MTRARLPFAVSLAFLLAAAVLAWLPAEAATAPDPLTSSDESSFSATKTLTRQFTEDDGSTYAFPSNTVTVNASQTQELRGRQRIQIGWTGAQPSGGRASNPYGEAGMNQEYPVVILQCRGRDDASLPLAEQVRPETCWTNSVVQRSQVLVSQSNAIWTKDALGTEADRQRLSGLAPFPGKDVCEDADQEPLLTHLTPFIAANGTVYPACDATTMPPEAAVGAAFPPAEIAAFSDENGAGSVQFEVRSNVENESLGCSDTVACTIEVIPINGLSCLQASTPASVTDTNCRLGGQFTPGSGNFVNGGVDAAASPALWWSGTNWSNRISIPIGFGLPPDTCDILDKRSPTGFYGSELMAQAALQWSPAYCLDKKRFKFQLNQMSDDAGWNLMEAGGGPAAFVSSQHKRRSESPVAYAPTAVTGFAISYTVDRPDNDGEYGELRLTPRLVAKLLTQSYPASALGTGHPGLENNPIAMMADPEFVELNPGLDQTVLEAGATLLSLSNDSDLVEQLTDWIAHDPAAMDFIKGQPDPWGMVVNPAYRKIKLPRSEWPLLDDYVPVTESTCRQANPTVYLSSVAAPVTTLRKIAEAMLDAWPNVQTRCDFDAATQAYKLGRIDRQSYGSRFMLGLVSLGDLNRYGLRAASLQTSPGTFVAPDATSLSAAVDLMQPKAPGKKKEQKGEQAAPGGARKPTLDPTRAYVLDQKRVRRDGSAYPGTMVVYTAAKTRDLAKADARRVALFIRTATTEGQQPGAGNGDLPGGFLPITASGPTRKLLELADAAAEVIEAQTPLPAEEPAPSESASAEPNESGPAPVQTQAPAVEPPGEAPVEEVPSAEPSAPPVVTSEVVMPETQAVSSDLGNRAVPVLLVLGLLGLAVSTGVRFLVRPPRGPQS